MSHAQPASRPTDPQTLNFLAGGGEMGALIRSHDWAATPLGAPHGWPQSLKTAVRIMLTSRQPIWIGWGEALIYLYNDAYKSIIGGKHPWALGRPTQEVWREIWSDIGPLLDTAMGGLEGTYVEAQLLIMERNGYPEETYYTFSYSPIPDDDGAPGGIICANTDDTQRVIGERQLTLLRELAARTSQARSWREACTQTMVALATDPQDLPFALLYMVEPGGDMALLAASLGAPQGPPAAPTAVPVAGPSPWPIGQVLATHEAQLIENLGDLFGKTAPRGGWRQAPTRAAALAVPAASEAGHAGVLIVGLNPLRLFDGDYSSFLGLAAGQIAAAIANADSYEEERRRAEALAELDRAKTAFFSNVSHEFRTPLTLMLGPLEAVLAGEVPADEIIEQVELAHRNGARLLRLVNSLLDFSRIEAGRVRAVFEPTDLSRFSAEIASSFRTSIEKAGLRLAVDCAPLPQPVYLDRKMWEKVLLNLLSNAFKFTLEGEIAVRVRPAENGRAARVEVQDSGIGIAAAELPKLFERFHRVAGAQGRTFEGSGIGLALVHELVKLHGGDIAVESVPGAGTTFNLQIPFGRAHLDPEQVREGQAQTSAPVSADAFVEEAMRWLPDIPADDAARHPRAASGLSAEAPEGSPGRGKRVLLADDSADMRSYVARLLEGQGYEVTSAADGAAALEMIRERVPDLVLTDVMMPRLDGFGLLRAIRSDPAMAATPVVMLSARAGEEAKVEGLDAGADDYLIKPFTARDLLARVNANIQMAEVRREAARALFQSEQRYQMTQERLALALSLGGVAVFEWEVESDRVAVLGPLAETFGVEVDATGLPLETFIQAIHPDDRVRVRAAIDHSTSTGEAYEAEYRAGFGSDERWLLARGRVGRSPGGGRRLAGALVDVTERLLAQRAIRQNQAALQEQTRALQILNRAAAAVSGDLDLKRLVQTVTDAGVEVSGAEFGAFFYNVVDTDGEHYTLYTLSGAPPEAFEAFPMPRNTAVFGPTFSGSGIVRSDDITQDPRYGRSAPYYGMPEEHLPVRSYLAVPVRSRTGEVLGGLFFGHAQPGMFGTLAEERVAGLASQAAVAMDNAQLFQAAQHELERRRQAEAALQAMNAGLEERVATEVAERAKVEDALRQAQKMEAVGQLTGGVAHDFNNLLTVIIGGLDTIRRSGPGDQVRLKRSLDMSFQAAERAASLTGRLLAFSRRQPLQPTPIELNILVREMTELLHRTLGEQVELEGVLAPRLWPVEVDRNQLGNVLLNLAVNARDAMPEGGKLTIETSNTSLDERYAAQDAEVIPGPYVAIAVSDTGVGMSKDTLARVFEPFFTTKEVGRGTGLGLSMVYGFVKQSGGHVTIHSEEGHGTTVKLYFPRYRGDAAADRPVVAEPPPVSSAGEVVLVVEDNDEVRAYSVMSLTELGYRVLQAAHADSALAILNSHQRVDLLFTDVILPGKSGRVLADAAAALRPGLKILFTTGYSRDAIVHHGRLDPGVQLISKPFTFEQLATRVRDLLDQPAEGGKT
jgi:signal transduction histidine kinase/DNA-binding response OmpR family regulator